MPSCSEAESSRLVAGESAAGLAGARASQAAAAATRERQSFMGVLSQSTGNRVGRGISQRRAADAQYNRRPAAPAAPGARIAERRVDSRGKDRPGNAPSGAPRMDRPAG